MEVTFVLLLIVESPNSYSMILTSYLVIMSAYSLDSDQEMVTVVAVTDVIVTLSGGSGAANIHIGYIIIFLLHQTTSAYCITLYCRKNTSIPAITPTASTIHLFSVYTNKGDGVYLYNS